ncbi:hypothetical protein [Salibacterium sp. K-3]
MNPSISPAEAKRQLERIADIYPYIKEEEVQTNDTVLTILNKQFHGDNVIIKLNIYDYQDHQKSILDFA